MPTLGFSLALNCHPSLATLAVRTCGAQLAGRGQAQDSLGWVVRRSSPTQGPALLAEITALHAHSFQALFLGSQIELAAGPIWPALGLILSGSSCLNANPSPVASRP